VTTLRGEIGETRSHLTVKERGIVTVTLETLCWSTRKLAITAKG